MRIYKAFLQLVGWRHSVPSVPYTLHQTYIRVLRQRREVLVDHGCFLSFSLFVETISGMADDSSRDVNKLFPEPRKLNPHVRYVEKTAAELDISK